ncbi:T9SS type A sorting domain-containing protein [candidate division KSB1 bacterium]|nr:T9SS type A sorting domain-containing protein [candidate division KSB1 bacterium]
MKPAFQLLASSRMTKLAAGAGVTLVVISLVLQLPLRWEQMLGADESVLTSMASVQNFQANYSDWKAAYERSGGDRYLILALGWSRGLSTEFTSAKGEAAFDLIDQSVAVEVKGLPEESVAEVWLVDNQPGPQRSVMPEPGDTMVRIGQIKTQSGVGRLQAGLDRETFANFNLDLVVISKADQAPDTGGILFGTPSLFQRLYRSVSNNRLGIPVYPSPKEAAMRAGLGFNLFPTTSQNAESSNSLNFGQLIQEGAEIFFNEKFEGNGRTCGTCHRLENNFTIDPEFIATLPPDDPLFVAEFTPALNSELNGGRVFENPTLMRQAGLIVENLDGFDDLSNKFVMRGVPHILSLRFSLKPSILDGTTRPPNERTGWSGDGAPGSGTLRDFATGAVTQHFTKTLARQPGADFRLPNDRELDALEAYQLSVGRPQELALLLTLFKNRDVTAGQGLFLGKGKCNLCHFNAGANIILTNMNGNFNTGVEDFPSPFADLGQPLPRDGGFGRTANGDGKGGFGDGTFNTPSLIEAGDTEPLFHNHISDTLESAVAFYSGDEFNNSPAGQFIGGINLNDTENFQVTAFLYVLNVLENIRVVNSLLLKALATLNRGTANEILEIAIAESDDAVESMADAKVQQDVVGILEQAKGRIENAQRTPLGFIRTIEISMALIKLEQARSSLILFGITKQQAESAEQETAPSTYALFQNFPNPFNPATEIRFQLPEASHVVVRIFNALGQEIRRLEDRQYEAGVHSVRWDGKNNAGNAVSSGIYIYQLQAVDPLNGTGKFSQVKKMNLLR